MKVKKHDLLIRMLLMLLLAASLTGCGRKNEVTSEVIMNVESSVENEPKEGVIDTYTFTDDTNAEVRVTKKPGKTAVLFASYADIWINSGGVVDITVEETVERGLVEENKALLVGKSVGKEINAEALIAAKPDFVILTADFPEHVELAELLRRSNIPVALFRVDQFEDYLKMLQICTDIMERSDAYETYGLQVKSRIEEIKDKVNGLPNKQSILFIRAHSRGMSAKTTDHFVGCMLEELNTDNIANHADILLDELSIEAIASEDPDYIFVTTMGDSGSAIAYMQDQINSNPVWQMLSAMRNDNYIILPKDLFQYKPNGNWDKSYEFLAKELYPEAFTNEQ